MPNLFSLINNLFLGIVIVLTTSLFVAPSTNNDKPCCSKKCTGSEYCSACKNCTGCAYCKNGGFCGVCHPEAFKKATVKQVVAPHAKQLVKPNLSVKKKN